MKRLDVQCKTVAHALNAIDNYPVISEKWFLIPPMYTLGTPSTYSIFLVVEHKINKEKVSVTLTIPLFEKVIKTLLEKYGDEAKERLVNVALATKHRRLVKHVWRYTDDETKKLMMAEVLGAK